MCNHRANYTDDKVKKICLLSVILFALCALDGCASMKQQERPAAHGTDKKYYTSSFPTRDVSAQLQKIQQSVKRITSHASYTMYHFTSPAITIKTIQEAGNPGRLPSIKSTVHHNRAGTAVCILRNNDYAAFVTADHILAFPDTLIAYRHGKHIPENKFIETMGIKKKQQNYLIMAAKISPIHILAEDKIRDIALLTTSGANNKLAPPLPISAGKARRLRLGSFVYVLGYPLGAPMVTRGIVSDPNYNSLGGFLTDAIYNHGISGGLIIASNDNFHSFHWVGMATAASATQHFYLVPNPSKNGSYWNREVYTDTVYISKKQTINYGLTESTPIGQIMTFLKGQERKLKELGLHLKNMH
jgi:hypothetical protein